MPKPTIMYISLSKGSPFYYRFLEIAGKFQEYGFTKFSVKVSTKKAETVLQVYERIKSDDLSIEQILVAFYVLFLGFFSSFLIFLGEILSTKF